MPVTHIQVFDFPTKFVEENHYMLQIFKLPQKNTALFKMFHSLQNGECMNVKTMNVTVEL